MSAFEHTETTQPRLCIGCENLFMRCKECALPGRKRAATRRW